MKSLYKACLGWLLMVCLSGIFSSCKPSVPSQYLSKGKITDILYDIHLAEAMANMQSSSSDSAIMISYREAVLRKHGVTSAEFDSSMVYYMRHTRLMHDIYLDLGDRLTAEAQSLGADVDNANRFGAVAVGDTANIWNGPGSLVLSASEPFNYDSFEIPVDSGFHKGDKVMLDFDAQFLFQDGMRDGIAVVAITYKNDSVYSNNVRITNSQHYSLQLDDRDSLGIKSIKGYFLLNSGDYNSGSSSMTTLKMMFIQNIKMIRMHPKSLPANGPQNGGGNASSDSMSRGSSSLPNGTDQELRPKLSGPDRQPLPPGKLDQIEMVDEKKH